MPLLCLSFRAKMATDTSDEWLGGGVSGWVSGYYCYFYFYFYYY